MRGLREGDFRISCQVKPRAPRSWKAGAGGETSRLGFPKRREWADWIFFKVVFSVL